MGALHAGHLSLIEKSRQENAYTACSIFVNPIQFNNREDLNNYPRRQEEDLAKLREAGCDFVILPTPEQMYPAPPRLRFDFGKLETEMEGKFRPGHFSGVATVVAKLFHVVHPDRAYFGQKDWQQYVIIRQMSRDLSFPLEVISCPTVRESDGLAMSSRNLRLSAEQRAQAPLIYQTLQQAKQALQDGQSPEEVQQTAWETLAVIESFEPEYLTIREAHSLLPLAKSPAGTRVVIATAVYLQPVRLIDNVLLEL